MNKYDKAKQVIDGLQRMAFDGDIVISIHDAGVSIRVAANGGVQPIATTPTRKVSTVKITEDKRPVGRPPKVATPPSTELPLQSIPWGRPGAKKDWASIIINELLKHGVTSIKDLENIKHSELKQTKGIGDIADIIRDSLKRAGYSLKAE